jgi:tetratricopeptide (TPR) repeat protein
MDATMEDAMSHYTNAYKEDPERFTKEADGYYAELLIQQMADSGERDRAFQMMDEMTQYAGAELEAAMNDIRESLFESPEERIEFYESQLAEAEDSEREELLANLRDLYDEVGNNERSQEVAMELYNLNPSFDNTRAVAEIYLSAGNYEQALEYLVEAVDKAEQDQARHDLMLETAEAYQQTEQYEKAREYARNAIDINENSGDAYLRIASIYANTIRSCVDGSKLEREDRAVYWLVIDYLEQAERVDESVASRARNQAESYRNAMPSDEDKFFNEWNVGDDFQINGNLKSCYAWVGETTTVR